VVNASRAVGRRVVVVGMAGSGKSTFSRALSAKTGLPVITLDLHYWKPGWTHPTETEWRDKQRRLLDGDAWIADGNYYDTLDLPLERADTVVLLETPWWMCAARAFVRGLRKRQVKLPEGCDDSAIQRLRDEWGIVGSVLRHRRSEPARTRALISRYAPETALHVLRSTREVEEFLEGMSRTRATAVSTEGQPG
jgi:adenylate kinase family enzyme